MWSQTWLACLPSLVSSLDRMAAAGKAQVGAAAGIAVAAVVAFSGIQEYLAHWCCQANRNWDDWATLDSTYCYMGCSVVLVHYPYSPLPHDV